MEIAESLLISSLVISLIQICYTSYTRKLIDHNNSTVMLEFTKYNYFVPIVTHINFICAFISNFIISMRESFDINFKSNVSYITLMLLVTIILSTSCIVVFHSAKIITITTLL